MYSKLPGDRPALPGLSLRSLAVITPHGQFLKV